MENLGSGLPNQQIEPLLLSIGLGSSSTRNRITHSGEEFVYMKRGSLTCRINEQDYDLEEGDSLLFLASQLQVYRNQTSRMAQILVIFQPMVGQLVAYRQYIGVNTGVLAQDAAPGHLDRIKQQQDRYDPDNSAEYGGAFTHHFKTIRQHRVMKRG